MTGVRFAMAATMTLEDLIRQHPGEYTVGEAAKLIDSTPGAVMLQLSASPTLVRTRDDRIDLRKKGRSGTGLTGALKGRIALLEGLLESLEWTVQTHGPSACPMCLRFSTTGHGSDCALGKALGRVP